MGIEIPPVEIRRLVADDAVAYREIRLRALKDHPESFGVSYDEEAALPMEDFRYRLEASNERIPYGAFLGDTLVGISMLLRLTGERTRHRAMITNVYVVPEARGQGASRKMMEALLEEADKLEGLDHLVLAVTVGNPVARELYIKLGFHPWGIQPRYSKVDDQFYDIEWMIKIIGSEI